jgi:hypothetical protein
MSITGHDTAWKRRMSLPELLSAHKIIMLMIKTITIIPPTTTMIMDQW